MRLEQLEYIVTLAKCSSLSEASDKLFIKQQSLGKAIKDLEYELGVQLLVRSNKGCTFTDEGKVVEKECESILQQIDNLKNLFAQVDSLNGEMIVLGCQASYIECLPKALKNFSSKYKNVIVNVMERDSFYIPTLYNQLMEKSETPIVGIINLPLIDQIGIETLPENFTFIPYQKGYWIAVVNNKHPFAKKKRITIESLLRENIVLNSPDYPQMGIDYALLSYFGDPKIKKTVSNNDLFDMAIENEGCVGITANFFMRDELSKSNNIIYKGIEPPIESMLGVIVDKKYEKNVLVETFVRHLLETKI